MLAVEAVSQLLRVQLVPLSLLTNLVTMRSAVGLGVGINSGVAVAGNMGSRNRLNYTVLGDVVNMASRLCSEAVAGEILATDATLQEAGAGVRRESRGGRALKGFSAELEVFEVLDVEGIAGNSTSGFR